MQFKHLLVICLVSLFGSCWCQQATACSTLNLADFSIVFSTGNQNIASGEIQTFHTPFCTAGDVRPTPLINAWLIRTIVAPSTSNLQVTVENQNGVTIFGTGLPNTASEQFDSSMAIPSMLMVTVSNLAGSSDANYIVQLTLAGRDLAPTQTMGFGNQTFTQCRRCQLRIPKSPRCRCLRNQNPNTCTNGNGRRSACKWLLQASQNLNCPFPTTTPTRSPSRDPSTSPTKSPTKAPTRSPVTTARPTVSPSKSPTLSPSASPSKSPTTANPSPSPSLPPSTTNPSPAPTRTPAPTPRGSRLLDVVLVYNGLTERITPSTPCLFTNLNFCRDLSTTRTVEVSVQQNAPNVAASRYTASVDSFSAPTNIDIYYGATLVQVGMGRAFTLEISVPPNQAPDGQLARFSIRLLPSAGGTNSNVKPVRNVTHSNSPTRATFSTNTTASVQKQGVTKSGSVAAATMFSPTGKIVVIGLGCVCGLLLIIVLFLVCYARKLRHRLYWARESVSLVPDDE